MNAAEPKLIHTSGIMRVWQFADGTCDITAVPAGAAPYTWAYRLPTDEAVRLADLFAMGAIEVDRGNQ